MKGGFMSDEMLFHKPAPPTLFTKVSGRVSWRSRGHRVCVRLCASVFVSHTDHMLVSSLQGSSDLCQNKLCYLCSRTHSMWKGHGAVPGGAAVRRCTPRTLTSCPTLRTYSDAVEKISVCFNVRLPLTMHGSWIALISRLESRSSILQTSKRKCFSGLSLSFQWIPLQISWCDGTRNQLLLAPLIKPQRKTKKTSRKRLQA